MRVLTKERLKKVDLFRVDLGTSEKHKLSSTVAVTTISHIDRFKSLDSKMYLLEVKFSRKSDPDIQIEVYINDSSLTKEKSIVFVPGNMVESLKRFYDLLGSLSDKIWWFEEHLDKDCFHFLSEGIDKKGVASICIIGGPIHMNRQFKEFCDAFRADMSSCGIDVEVKAILDEKTLELLHGRFLFDESNMYVIPSSNIVSKKFDAVVPILNPGDALKIRGQVQKIWRNSTKISNWKKIQEKRKDLLPGTAL